MEGYWVQKGDLEPMSDPNYVATSMVKKNMGDVARILAARYAILFSPKFPDFLPAVCKRLKKLVHVS